MLPRFESHGRRRGSLQLAISHGMAIKANPPCTLFGVRKPVGQRLDERAELPAPCREHQRRTCALRRFHGISESIRGPWRGPIARHQFSAAFLADLAEVWAEHGRETMLKTARSSPETFFATCARLLPKDRVRWPTGRPLRFPLTPGGNGLPRTASSLISISLLFCCY